MRFESLLFLFRVGEEPAEAGFKGRGFGERGVEFVGNRFHLRGCTASGAADDVESLQVGDDSYVFGRQVLDVNAIRDGLFDRRVHRIDD